MLSKFFYTAICIMFLIAMQTGFSGCIKEYSFEGSIVPDSLPDTTTIDSIPVIDSVPGETLHFPYCYGCRSTQDLQLSEWSFYYDTSFLCGTITGAVMAPERNAFTFFGPSACSADTGIVLTVYLGSQVLDNDKSNIITNSVIFEYYDNVTQFDVFLSDLSLNFSLTIDSYEYGTGICKGRFSGFANTKSGGVAEIKNGKFAIQFPQ